jgi:hypothetical protein
MTGGTTVTCENRYQNVRKLCAAKQTSAASIDTDALPISIVTAKGAAALTPPLAASRHHAPPA